MQSTGDDTPHGRLRELERELARMGIVGTGRKKIELTDPGLIALERELAQIRGVSSASIFPSGDEIEEVHVTVHAGRHPTDIVDDVQAVVRAHSGRDFDFRRILLLFTGGDTA